MYRLLATLTAKAGLTAGVVLLLTIGTLIPGAARVSADECPVGTVPIIDVNGDPQCVPEDEAPASPVPTSPDPSGPPAPTPTDQPTPAEEPATTPSAEPTPAGEPESSPAVVAPPATAVPVLPQAPPTQVATPTPTPTKRTQAPEEPSDAGTPGPAAVLPEQPANADVTGVIVPGDGPRLLWAVAAGASASGLLAAIVAFYLVSVRPFFLARRRPDGFGRPY